MMDKTVKAAQKLLNSKESQDDFQGPWFGHGWTLSLKDGKLILTGRSQLLANGFMRGGKSFMLHFQNDTIVMGSIVHNGRKVELANGAKGYLWHTTKVMIVLSNNGQHDLRKKQALARLQKEIAIIVNVQNDEVQIRFVRAVLKAQWELAQKKKGRDHFVKAKKSAFFSRNPCCAASSKICRGIGREVLYRQATCIGWSFSCHNIVRRQS
jgi:hypothetical protein